MGRSDEVLRTTCSDAAADQQRDPSPLCTPVVHGPRPLGPGRWVERSAEGFLHVWDLDWTDGVLLLGMSLALMASLGHGGRGRARAKPSNKKKSGRVAREKRRKRARQREARRQNRGKQ